MKKVLSSGVSSPNKKSPDKKGAFIDVQKKTLGNMRCGGKAKKGK